MSSERNEDVMNAPPEEKETTFAQLIEVLLMSRETETKPQSGRCQGDGGCETACAPDAETES